MTDLKRLIDVLIQAKVTWNAWGIANYLVENDVVKVVRCKDCKHCQQYQKWNFDKYLGCNFNEEIYEVEPNHFCSYGERKETNDR